MRPGDTLDLTTKLEDAAGAAVTGEAANISVAAYLDGVSTAVGETVTEIGSSGWYKVSLTLPASAGFLLVRLSHTGTATTLVPDLFSGEVESADLDSIAETLSTSTGEVASNSADDGDLGDVVEGDAWASGTLTVPTAFLSRFGYSDLSGMTISAALKDAPDGTEVGSAEGVSASIISTTSRTVKVSWTTWPTELDLGSTETEKVWYLDIQLKHTGSGQILTPLRYTMRVVWQRDSTA